MKSNALLADDVDFNYLSENTKNYTGAEIEAVCRGATSFALFKDTDLNALNKKEEPKENSKSSKKA